MTRRLHEQLIIMALLVAGAVVFSLGINWGIPSRNFDPYLFGKIGSAWTGKEILAAGGAWQADSSRPADAANGPALDRSQVIWLNQTKEEQARIIERYRLYSYQPDEMVTFRALSGMRGGNLDPRMYQYGGLWIYPMGVLLKVVSIAGAVELHPDFGFYLDHPEAFGRFYIVARLYSASWGLIGIWAVFRIARRFSDRLVVPATAGAVFLLMPVVINGAHEAKPHLAGAVLMLLSVLAALKFVEAGVRKWWIVTGVMCGLAIGMVLSSAVVLLVIPLMVLLRPIPWKERAKLSAMAIGIALVVYAMTNPFVPINLIRNPAIVRQNLSALGHAGAIVGKSSDIGAIQNARRLIVDGASMVGGVTGLIGLLIMVVNHSWWRDPRWRAPTVLLGVPSALILIQFTLLASGKAGEFGRFFVLPDVALVIVAVVLVSRIGWGRWIESGLCALLVFIAGFQGLAYCAGFIEDMGATASRLTAAAKLEEFRAMGARTLAVRAEPAPYSLPPVEITSWKLLLLPANWQVSAAEDSPDVIISPVDQVGAEGDIANTPYRRIFVSGKLPWIRTSISWADKPFEILVKRDLLNH